MEIDRGNETAARSIQETRVEQKRRDEREQTDREIVSAGETALAEANTLMAQQKYGDALNVYQKAMALFDNVSSEFKAQREQAEAGKKDATGNIRKAITEIISPENIYTMGDAVQPPDITSPPAPRTATAQPAPCARRWPRPAWSPR